MEGRIDEGKIKRSIDALSLENIDKITGQMKNSICQVYGDLIGTGFFCKIPYEGKKIPVLMTNYHIISDDFLQKNKKIKISMNDAKVYDTIKINENNKIYSSVRDEYDIMVIKLEEEQDIYHYLYVDEHLLDKDSENIYEDKSLYILHYPNDDKVHVSFGNGIQKFDKNYFKHSCNTEHCSSGSPILNLKTNKVIGIHSGAIINEKKETKFNIGILLKYPLNELTNYNCKNNNINNNFINNLMINNLNQFNMNMGMFNTPFNMNMNNIQNMMMNNINNNNFLQQQNNQKNANNNMNVMRNLTNIKMPMCEPTLNFNKKLKLNDAMLFDNIQNNNQPNIVNMELFKKIQMMNKEQKMDNKNNQFNLENDNFNQNPIINQFNQMNFGVIILCKIKAILI